MEFCFIPKMGLWTKLLSKYRSSAQSRASPTKELAEARKLSLEFDVRNVLSVKESLEGEAWSV